MKKKDVIRVARESLAVIDQHASSKILDGDFDVSTVCRLWAGMGHIYLVKYRNGSCSVIVKHISRNTSQSFGDLRKAKSYQVEANFYEHVAPTLLKCHSVNVPRPFLVERHEMGDIAISMEFIDNSGDALSDDDGVRSVLQWLAKFHAAYWGEEAASGIQQTAGLQELGSYWYLDTRPDEHANMPNHGWQGRLKRAARAIDNKLRRDSLQCIIHGDAKDANVIFKNGKVYLCDFQYCGKGPPTKDLAYFFCSSVSPENEQEMLEYYLQELTNCLTNFAVDIPTMADLEESMTFAYCDYYRFMSGWGFWGSGAEDRVIALLDRLDGGTKLATEDDYDQAILREFG